MSATDATSELWGLWGSHGVLYMGGMRSKCADSEAY
jgi:hypothetical protein